jgi:hypothetical protein
MSSAKQNATDIKQNATDMRTVGVMEGLRWVETQGNWRKWDGQSEFHTNLLNSSRGVQRCGVRCRH